MVFFETTQSFKKQDRAGCIILNRKDNTILIIQSYGTFWGLPKGHREQEESMIQCAIRETFEETGIQLSEKDLTKSIQLYNGEVMYYFVEGDNLQYNIEKIQDRTEITDIKWVSIDFLEQNRYCTKNRYNSHLKKLLPYIREEFNNSGK